MQQLVEILKNEGLTLVVRQSDGSLYRGTGRGVSDLYDLLKARRLDGAWVADKVVGRGAAALMIAGGVVRVHALTMSRPAVDLLKDSDLDYSTDLLVDQIMNQKGDGQCPVEHLTSEAATAAECVPLIASFVNTIRNKTKE